jgi:hypothetical protein
MNDNFKHHTLNEPHVYINGNKFHFSTDCLGFKFKERRMKVIYIGLVGALFLKKKITTLKVPICLTSRNDI